MRYWPPKAPAHLVLCAVSIAGGLDIACNKLKHSISDAGAEFTTSTNV